MSFIGDHTVPTAITGDLSWVRKALLRDPFFQKRDPLTIFPRLVEDLAGIDQRYRADGCNRSRGRCPPDPSTTSGATSSAS